MPQKPLLKPGKKIQKATAANRHGKQSGAKKGAPAKPPKSAKALAKFNEAKELTKVINANNESNLAGRAAQAGGRLSVIKAPLPINQTKDQQKRAKEQKKALKAVDAMES